MTFTAGVSALPGHSRLYWALSDSAVLVRRNVRHITRNVDQLISVVLIPVVVLLMFRFMFGGAIDTGTTYINYLIAGVVVLSVATNAMSTSVAVRVDLMEGIVERFRSMPVLAPAVLVGHVVASVVRNLITIALMFGVGLLVGFRPTASPLNWVAVVGLLLLFSFALAWLSAILGIVARSVEGASGLSLVLFFLPYASSAFVPTSTMPAALRAFVDNQPMSLVIDTIRPLLVGGPVGNTGWYAVAWWLAILAVAVPVAAVLLRRRSAAPPQ